MLNSWQQAQHTFARLDSDLRQKELSFGSSGFTTEGTLISVFVVWPSCGGVLWDLKGNIPKQSRRYYNCCCYHNARDCCLSAALCAASAVTVLSVAWDKCSELCSWCTLQQTQVSRREHLVVEALTYWCRNHGDKHSGDRWLFTEQMGQCGCHNGHFLYFLSAITTYTCFMSWSIDTVLTFVLNMFS